MLEILYFFFWTIYIRKHIRVLYNQNYALIYVNIRHTFSPLPHIPMIIKFFMTLKNLYHVRRQLLSQISQFLDELEK